jgi:hypothetical protein
MGRRARPPIRLEIVGLSSWVFEACRQSSLSISGIQGRNRAGASASVSTDVQSKLGDVPKDLVELHSKIALIVVDFERAYGRRVEVRVFERSSNRFFDFFLKRGGRRHEVSSSESPEFYVNGLRVFRGVPDSFSQLDEAIDKAFGASRP